MAANRRVFLVDTPGFNDTRCSDTAIFQEIAFFLGQAYTHRATLGGIIYLHRITDNRMSGSAMRSLTLLKKMCGHEAAKYATLVTTMWDGLRVDGVDYHKACKREEELRHTTEYWGSMLDQGSRIQRWYGTRASALSTLTGLLWTSDNRGPATLKIQKELIDQNKDLDETSAGIELAKHHGAAWQRLQMELKSIRKLHDQALQVRDDASARRFRAQKATLEGQLEKAEAAERDLRDDLELLFAAKRKEYRKQFIQGQKEVEVLSQQVEELQIQLGELRRRVDRDAMAFEGEKQSWARERPGKGRANGRPRLDKVQEERYRQYKLAHESNKARKQAVEKELDKVQKRKVLKRNMLAILGVLGGTATIAAGAATMQIPVVAAGIALVGTAGMKLDFSRKKKTKKQEEEWEVNDHDAS